MGEASSRATPPRSSQEAATVAEPRDGFPLHDENGVDLSLILANLRVSPTERALPPPCRAGRSAWPGSASAGCLPSRPSGGSRAATASRPLGTPSGQDPRRLGAPRLDDVFLECFSLPARATGRIVVLRPCGAFGDLRAWRRPEARATTPSDGGGGYSSAGRDSPHGRERGSGTSSHAPLTEEAQRVVPPDAVFPAGAQSSMALDASHTPTP